MQHDVSKLSHMRFEPSGLTNDADIRAAKSIVDYIFRWFGKKFDGRADRVRVRVQSRCVYTSICSHMWPVAANDRPRLGA